MAKLSEQLREGESTERPTRTKRIIAQREQEVARVKQVQLQNKIKDANEKLSSSTYEEYEEEYNKLDPEIKKYFKSPDEIKQTQGYQDYLQEKAEYDKKVEEYNQQVKAQEKASQERAEWEQAFNYFTPVYKDGMTVYVLKGKRYDPRTPVGRKINQIADNQSKALQSLEYAKSVELGKHGVTPIYQGGLIAGYKDEFGNVTYSQDLSKLQIKVNPDEAYAEWEKTKTPVEDRFVVKPEPSKPKASLEVVGFEKGKETVDNRPFYTKIEDVVDEKIISPVAKYFGGKVSAIWNIPSELKVPIFVGAGGSISLTPFIEKGQEKLADIDASISKKALGGKGENLTKEYEGYQQAVFEEKYMKDILYGEKTFEQASDEFVQSDEGKLLQKNFQEDYEKLERNVRGDDFFSSKYWKGTLYGVERTAIGVGISGLEILKSPVKTSVVVGSIVALKKIPAPTLNELGTLATVGFGTYGAIKFFDPTSTYTEAGAGLVTLAISGSILGYKAYRYLKAPVVKTVKIPAPKRNLKSSSVVGRDIKIITKEGKVVNKVVYNSQKLSQTVTAGRRTVVTTRIREIFGAEPIYKGVPTSQLGKTYSFETFRGTYTFKTSSGYQKAFNKLVNYGYTSSQARSTLRFIAPRVYEQYLDKGVLYIKGNKAIGEFTYLTKRPVIEIDKNLGIKTRGASTIKDVYRIERKLVSLGEGKGNVVIEENIRLTSYLRNGKLTGFKSFDFSRSFNFGKASELKQGYAVLKGKDLDLIKAIKYKDISSLSLRKQLFPSDKFIRVETSETQLIRQTIDKTRYGLGKAVNVKKTPLSKTFSDKTLIKEIKDISTKATPNIQKEISKLAQSTGIEQLKKTPKISPTKITQVKNLIKLNQIEKLAFGQSTIPALSSSAITLQGLKEQEKLKSNVQLKNLLKNNVKEDQITKLKLSLSQAQSPALTTKQIVKQSFKEPTLSLNLNLATPNIRTPEIKPPTIKPPVIPPFLLKGLVEKKINKRRKGFNEFAYLPDFTARAIGLDPEILTQKKAEKRLKKILTGLEIRRGVLLK